MDKASVDIFVVVDENGDYAIGTTQDEAHERYAEDVGATVATRVVQVNLMVPLPKPVVVTGTVPEESAAGCELTVA